MNTTVIEPVKAFTLIALGVAIAAMGIHVADADDAPGAAVIGMPLMVVGRIGNTSRGWFTEGPLCDVVCPLEKARRLDWPERRRLESACLGYKTCREELPDWPSCDPANASVIPDKEDSTGYTGIAILATASQRSFHSPSQLGQRLDLYI